MSQYVRASRVQSSSEVSQYTNFADFKVNLFVEMLAMQCCIQGNSRSLDKKLSKLCRKQCTPIPNILLLLWERKDTKTAETAKLTEPVPLQFTLSELRRLLLLHCVEQFTLLEEVLSRALQPEVTIVTTDIKAMYAYHCGQYRQCLQLKFRECWETV